MKNPAKIAIGASIALLLIATGFGIGTYIKYRNNPEPATLAKPIQFSADDQAPISAPNTNVYTISAPSRGRANFSIPIVFDNLSGTLGIAYLKKTDAAGVSTDKNILLFDADGNVMDGIGKITDIAEGTGMLTDYIGVSYIITNLPEKSPPPARGEIVIDSISQAKRLPRSALLQNEDGYYLWEVVSRQGNHATVSRHKIALAHVINDDFFIFEQQKHGSNLYILNPNSALEDGQNIAIRETLYSPGYVGNDQDLASAPKRIYPDRALEEKILNETQNRSAACSTSCSPGADQTNAFIERVKSLAKQAEPTP